MPVAAFCSAIVWLWFDKMVRLWLSVCCGVFFFIFFSVMPANAHITPLWELYSWLYAFFLFFLMLQKVFLWHVSCGTADPLLALWMFQLICPWFTIVFCDSDVCLWLSGGSHFKNAFPFSNWWWWCVAACASPSTTCGESQRHSYRSALSVSHVHTCSCCIIIRTVLC